VVLSVDQALPRRGPEPSAWPVPGRGRVDRVPVGGWAWPWCSGRGAGGSCTSRSRDGITWTRDSGSSPRRRCPAGPFHGRGALCAWRGSLRSWRPRPPWPRRRCCGGSAQPEGRGPRADHSQ